MSCTKHLLNFQWEDHSWRRRVASTEYVSANVTEMWGRVVQETHVRCHTQQVCTVCGQIGREADCMCDTTEGEHCAIRLARLEAVQTA